MAINHSQPQNGFALLLSIMVASVLLALGLTMLTITTKQLTLSSTARESEIAFQASVAGLECIMFHARLNDVDYITGPGSPPDIDCFSLTQSASQETDFDSAADGDTHLYQYEISWPAGSADRCSRVDLYMMVPSGASDYSVDFSSVTTAIQNKTCQSGSWCPVIVAEGYNKSCTDVAAGLATVQRELTAQ